MTQKTEAELAQDKANKAGIEAAEAQRKVADAGKTKEQVAADEAAQKADDLRAKAKEAKSAEEEAAAVPTTVVEAGVLVIAAPNTMAGDHLAQKFGNDPANPKPAPGVDMNSTVKLSRKTPDVAGLVYCDAPKEMVGDYLRAGWNVA